MEVIILKDREQVSELAAKRLTSLVHNNPQAVLGLATGSTPVETYKKFVSRVEEKKISCENITCFNLDEYVGLSSDHPQSYFQFMKTHFYDPLKLNQDQCFIPNGMADDMEKECQTYEQLIEKKGPIDLQILGIGRDAHIGFNEPGSSLGSHTRLKTLTETTRQDNAQYFGSLEEVPVHCVTMGVASILKAKEIILLAFGESKAKAIADAVEGPVSAWAPASGLQFHPKTKIVIDEAAASQLKNKAYYQEVFQKKPEWQNLEFL